MFLQFVGVSATSLQPSIRLLSQWIFLRTLKPWFNRNNLWSRSKLVWYRIIWVHTISLRRILRVKSIRRFITSCQNKFRYKSRISHCICRIAFSPWINTLKSRWCINKQALVSILDPISRLASSWSVTFTKDSWSTISCIRGVRELIRSLSQRIKRAGLLVWVSSST